MLGKYYKLDSHLPETHQYPYHHTPQRIRSKRSQELQKKILQKKIFGEHYNYNRHGLNKEKKYMLEEQKNTEIERANRILLEKIRKIGERSVQLPSKHRMMTQKATQSSSILQRSTKINNFYSRKQTPFRSTQHQVTRSKVSLLPSPRRSEHQDRRTLFKGCKQIEGVQLEMEIYIEGGMYFIESFQHNMHHKIHMTLQNYHMLLAQSLENNHANIFQLLSFNGNLLELAGTRRQNVSRIQQQLTLPVVQKPVPSNILKHSFEFPTKAGTGKHRVITQ